MSNFLHLLTRYLTTYPEGVCRVVENTPTLITTLARFSEADRDDVLVSFEEQEQTLRNTVVVEGWSLLHNPYTDRVICERVMDPNALERFADVANASLRTEVTRRCWELGSRGFELLVVAALAQEPWVAEVVATEPTADGGFDLRGLYLNPADNFTQPLLGQVKHWRDRADAPVMQSFIGALHTTNAPRYHAVFVASSGFTEGALRHARAHAQPIRPYTLDDIVDILIARGTGILTTTIRVSGPDEDFWNQLHDERDA